MKPGIYSIPSEHYHADPAPEPSLSASLIKVMLNQSPLHGFHAHPRLNPNHVSKEDEKFDLGTAAHSLVLEGVDCMEVIEAADYRSKLARELRDEARAKGRVPVLAEKARHLREMVAVANEAISNCTDLSGFTFAGGLPEQTVIWQDGGVWCRSRIDMLANDYSLILDYKTTSGSAAPERASRQLLDQLDGSIQAAMNRRGVLAVTGKNPAFVFCVQELAAPYAVSFIGVDPAYLAMGEDKVETGIALWRQCLTTRKWPGYGNRIYYPAPKPWEIDRWSEKSDEMQQRGEVNWEFGEVA